MRKTVCAVALLVSSPAWAEQFPDFRSMWLSQAQSYKWPGAPEDLQQKARVCLVDSMLALYMSNELADLDAFARGEKKLTTGQLRKLEEVIQIRAERIGGRDKLVGDVCPDTYAEMKKYAPAN